MWSHCTFCSRDLGRNEVVETFPIGRRLAFDAARGRLWAVCKRCGGWNLTPLDERWEAVEDCEALFRLVRTRVSTGELGLAKLREGLELVRIGRPLRPEFAAWRYGAQFGPRHRRAILGSVVGSGAVVGLGWGVAFAGGPVGAMVVVAAAGGAGVLSEWYFEGRFTSAKVTTEDGQVRVVRGRHIRHACLVRSDEGGGEWPGWELSLPIEGHRERVRGPHAARITARLVRRVNGAGGSKRQVREALTLIRLEGHPEDFLRTLVDERGAEAGPPKLLRVYASGNEVQRLTMASWPGTRRAYAGSLGLLDPGQRLALEMALSEEQERRAMEGELALLEAAWREAEEIAAIADRLLEPEGAGEFIARHSGEGGAGRP